VPLQLPLPVLESWLGGCWVLRTMVLASTSTIAAVVPVAGGTLHAVAGQSQTRHSGGWPEPKARAKVSA
jgi:hypothetical protein